MGKIYVAIVKGDSDWITFSRGHFLKEALMDPEFGGIYYFDPDDPRQFMTDKSEGWTLYMCGHGDEYVICGQEPKVLAKALAPCLPDTQGLIFALSCKTGSGCAKQFYEKLVAKGKNVVVRAPKNNNTFTTGMGFRVLDPPAFTATHDKRYQSIKKSLAPTGCGAEDLAKRVTSGQEVSAICAEMARKSDKFWLAFNKEFSGCFSMMGAGWVAFPPS